MPFVICHVYVCVCACLRQNKDRQRAQCALTLIFSYYIKQDEDTRYITSLHLHAFYIFPYFEYSLNLNISYDTHLA